jgi:hypothetical protein
MKTINISNPTYFSAHRAGWGYVMNGMMKFHSSESILLDDFIDITFGYNASFNLQKKRIPYRKPWIGFLHHPPKICPWYEFDYKNSIDINNFLYSEVFLSSLEHCRGIFVLSDYLKNYLEDNFPQFKNIPIFSMKHPTEFGLYDWDFNKFKTFYKDSGIKLLSIGYFLRNLSTLFLVSAPKKLDKILLPSHMEMALTNLEKEIEYKGLEIDKTRTKILTWQNNNFYDKILEQCVVLLDLYDTSCNNAIIECAIRNTPMIINKHPAIIEYLGKDYPSYFKDISDISELLNYDNIQTTVEYLQNKSKDELTIDYFLSNFQTNLKHIDWSISSRSNIKKNIDNNDHPTNLLIKSSKFSHRFGWEWVMGNVQKNNIFSHKKTNNTIYCNDFIEHTFRNEKQDNKSIVINDKKYGMVRGYNFFSLNNNDVFMKNNEYYLWNNDTQSWSRSKEEEVTKLGINFKKIETYQNNNWIGFLHNPINMPRWFDYNQNIKSLLHNDDFIKSLDNCKLIFVLSDDLKNELSILFHKYNIDVKIKSLKHPVPTIPETNKWNYDLFLESRNLLQIGYWMRKMHSFWEVQSNLNKIWLYGDKYASRMIDIENTFADKKDVLNSNDILNIYNIINSNSSDSVNNVYISKVNDETYDKLLRSSLIYVNFYDCAASNTVVEAIASCSPLLINKLPSIVEYLGEDYPMYFRDIRQASSMSNDIIRIKEANDYLIENEYLREQLDINNFVSSFYKECSKVCKR